MTDPTPPPAPTPMISTAARLWISRTLMTLVVAGVGWLQTGQISLEGGETARDTDTVALLKAMHQLELRVVELEHDAEPGPPPMLPSAEDLPTPTMASATEPAVTDVQALLARARSNVTPEEVETYQQAK